jgi:hypothetical protein
LYSQVELDEHDKKILRLKLQVQDLEEAIFTIDFSLNEEEKPYYDIKRARDEANWYCQMLDEDREQRYLDLVDSNIEYLRDKHMGDCTCIPRSCAKCHAEGLMNIDTIPGLKKHEANFIDGAFGRENNKTIEEAIAYLENYKPIKTAVWDKDLDAYERNVERWTEEAARACEWLKNYKKNIIDNQ